MSWAENTNPNCPWIPGLKGMIYYPPTTKTIVGTDQGYHAFYIEDRRLTHVEAYDWCEANAKGEWKVRRGIEGTPVFVTFWNDEDAMLFRLTW